MKKNLFLLSLSLLLALQLFAQDQTINGTTFKQDGKVGVGTTSPEEKLHINGTATITGDIGAVTSSHWNTGAHTLELQNSDAGDVVLSFHRAGYTNAAIKHSSLGGLIFSGSGAYDANHMFLKYNGYLGIGTTSPVSLLDISTIDGKSVRFNFNDESAVTFRPNNGNSIFHLSHGHDNKLYISQGATVGAGKLMTIENSGNIGIGTTSPTDKLEVAGNLRINGSNTNDQIRFESQNGFHRIAFHQLRFYDWEAGGDNLTINNGNIGVGTTTPNAQLVIGNNFGASLSGSSGGNAVFGTNLAVQNGGVNHNKLFTPYTHTNNYGYAGIQATWNTINFYTKRSNTTENEIVSELPRMTINELGEVGIGTTDTKGFKLGVQGKIAAEEVKVATYTNWSDFVFDKDYNLPTLKEVEQHIKEKGHLEDMPNAEEVKKDGFFLAEMNAKLLQKIEELTLYTIQQEKKLKELDGLKEENKELKEKFVALETLVTQMIKSSEN